MKIKAHIYENSILTAITTVLNLKINLNDNDTLAKENSAFTVKDCNLNPG
jgi:dynactin complex subunit